MSGEYGNPPVIEAVCEFRFDPSEEWDFTLAGMMYERVRDLFPKRKTIRQFRFAPASQAGEGLIEPQLLERLQFLKEDRSALLQLSPNLVSINCLEPYPGWSEFRSMIFENTHHYIEIARPAGISRIGLRYINRIELPFNEGSVLELEDYFNIFPRLEGDLPKDHGPFIAGVHLIYRQEKDKLKLELQSAEPKREGAAPCLLDLDYYLDAAGDVKLEGFQGWVDYAHSILESVFEASITDRTRALFQEVES